MSNFLNQNKIKACPQRSRLRGGRGFTLVETLVAISIFTVSILGLMAVMSSGLADTNYAKRRVVASYLAQEGIEYIRNLRDTYVLYDETGPQNGWTNFMAKISACGTPNYCAFNDAIVPTEDGSIYACDETPTNCKLYLDTGNYSVNISGEDSGFTRLIQMTEIDSGSGVNELHITSTVSWVQGSGTNEITFSEAIYNWVE